MEREETSEPVSVDLSASLTLQGQSSVIDCQSSCFESCIDLSSSFDQFEEFEIVKSHELEGWEQTSAKEDTESGSNNDFFALTLSSMAESLMSSFKLSELDFEVIEIDSGESDYNGDPSASVVGSCATILDRVLRDRERELADLQNASCVSTGDARSNLSQFFNRYNQDESNASPNEAPAPIQEPEHQMRSDVQSVMQQSIVTSALNRGPFRELLERTLGARQPLAPPPQRPVFDRSNQRERQRNTRQNRNAEGSQQSRESLRASLLAEIRNYQPREPRSLPTHINLEHAAEIRASRPGTQSAANRAVAPPSAVSTQQISRLQQRIQQGVAFLSETINQDLRQLNQYSRVTSVLNGHFRTQLESLVQRHVDTVGNGPEVQDFIRSLGLNRTQPDRATMPQRSQSLDDDFYSELRSLKLQMNEMRRMMQMNVEVQLDVQRAIRQEVAAVMGAVRQQITSQLHNALQEQSSSDTGPMSLPALLSQAAEASDRNHPTVDAGACAICLDRRVDAVFYQCGHMCVCIQCGLQLKADNHSCPVCRATIQDVIRTYQSQV